MKNKFVYVVWCARIITDQPISFRPKHEMWVFPTYMSALRFVAIQKAERSSPEWRDWRTMHKDVYEDSNTNMLVLELTYRRVILRYIVTRAPISQEVFRF